MKRTFSVLLVLFFTGCTASTPAPLVIASLTPEGNGVSTQAPTTESPTSLPLSTQTPILGGNGMNESVVADVLTVKVTAEPNAYQFHVEVSSPDTGCGQYADWWEVLSEDGQLLYRRVLLHSHVDEQPFTRSGGPVPVSENTVVFVRAHMNTDGYGGRVLKGSVTDGFQPVDVEADFAVDVETLLPLPEGCAF